MRVRDPGSSMESEQEFVQFVVWYMTAVWNHCDNLTHTLHEFKLGCK